MVFYKPFSFKFPCLVEDIGVVIPTLIYPSEGAEKVFDRLAKGCIEGHLTGLWTLHDDLIAPDTGYILAMPWEDSDDRMVDLWLYSEVETYGSGPLMNQKTFRNHERDTKSRVACGNAVVLLGVEEEHRVATGDLQKYLFGERPVLPERLRIDQEFYKNYGR